MTNNPVTAALPLPTPAAAALAAARFAKLPAVPHQPSTPPTPDILLKNPFKKKKEGKRDGLRRYHLGFKPLCDQPLILPRKSEYC